jgi:hypothetical protein
MRRIVVSQENIISWLNDEIAKHEECIDCRVTSITRLEEQGEDGCNWVAKNLRCSGTITRVCQPVLEQVIAQARAKFNIE